MHSASTIDMGYWPNWLRLGAAAVLLVCSVQMFLMLMYYVQRVMPLRQKINESRVVAPPAGWTLAYHCIVLVMVLTSIATRIQLATWNAPPTIATYIYPGVGIALCLVVSKFLKYYAHNLNKAVWDQEHPEIHHQ